ncbi:hypothetical protein BDV95DRAFT_358014 [Massariosphaeria phaeospora]|uniref:DUF6594 domain-containing protein n=1 Tax=Massariosphaeria phaeospora TaxID=100035 RepID=A0A7C8M7K8_9PLEO|nr:hypothetical protein BDV95DRAFT_358014 [Massariosphaeria phaeospora]
MQIRERTGRVNFETSCQIYQVCAVVSALSPARICMVYGNRRRLIAVLAKIGPADPLPEKILPLPAFACSQDTSAVLHTPKYRLFGSLSSLPSTSCIMFGRLMNKDSDPEAPKEKLDFADPRWIVDHHKHNLITTIADGHSSERSYRISIAEMQRIHLRQLQHKLIQHAVDLRFEDREPSEWARDLRDFVQALQDHDYMGQRSQLPRDPFYVTGERYIDRHMLGAALDGWSLDDTQQPLLAKDVWETADTRPEPVGGTRDGNRWRAFQQRLRGAVVGGVFLIAPMWINILHRTLYTALVSTTVFVAAFGLLMAALLDRLIDVMSSTAAYAAVLVVFVGLTTDKVT